MCTSLIMLRRGERDDTENKKNSTVLLWKLGRVIWILTVVMGLLGIFIQSKAVQSVILYTHVMNYPFWLHDTAYHGLPEARNIKGFDNNFDPLHWSHFTFPMKS